MKTFPRIHPLKANKHGVKQEIPAAIVLPLTCFPRTRLNSMKRRSTRQGRKRANYLQPARNYLQNRIGQNPSQQVMIISKPPPPLLLLRWMDRQTDRQTDALTHVRKRKRKKNTLQKKKKVFFPLKRSCSLFES